MEGEGGTREGSLRQTAPALHPSPAQGTKLGEVRVAAKNSRPENHQRPCLTCTPEAEAACTPDPRGFTPRPSCPLPLQGRDFLSLGLLIFAWFSTIQLVAFHWAQQCLVSLGKSIPKNPKQDMSALRRRAGSWATLEG